MARHTPSGWRFERFDGSAVVEPGGVTLAEYRRVSSEAAAALRMIRQALEQHIPPGNIPSEEHVASRVAPTLMAEAEMLVGAIEKAG